MTDEQKDNQFTTLINGKYLLQCNASGEFRRCCNDHPHTTQTMMRLNPKLTMEEIEELRRSA